MSPPHGGVDRNQNPGDQYAGAWESPPHGGVDRNAKATGNRDGGRKVAPSRGRGSKRASRPLRRSPRSRPLTGAWIETSTRRSCHRMSGVAPSRGRGSKRIGEQVVRCHLASPPHGGVDRNPYALIGPLMAAVAPSRGRGSKRRAGTARTEPLESPPHGGVDRNKREELWDKVGDRRPLTGAWIETSRKAISTASWAVAPSRGRGSKPKGTVKVTIIGGVAPSRGRGSKLVQQLQANRADSRPLTGAWIETSRRAPKCPARIGRPLTGAWIETIIAAKAWGKCAVAPSRGRGSKHRHADRAAAQVESPPHGGVDRNSCVAFRPPSASGRPLTGAWIETFAVIRKRSFEDVASSRGRGSKLSSAPGRRNSAMSPPHGGVDRN